jgi:IS605 OrfB family transposase
MRQTITAKLKLEPNAEQSQALRNLGLAYRDALIFSSDKAFELGKTTNANLLHKNTYAEIRSRFGLPSQMACSVSRYVTAAYKTLWTTTKKNAKDRKLGNTKRVYRGLDNAPKFSSRTAVFQSYRDFTFKTDQRVSIITLNGRITISYKGWAKHINLIQEPTTHIGGAKLFYDKTKHTYYLLVSIEVEIEPATPTNTVGVDLGQRYLAVATDTANNTLFVPGGQCVQRARKYHSARQSLQQKKKANHKNGRGTRSVTKRLISVSGRERRHKLSINHQTASAILDRFPNSTIGLENLTDIRQRTGRRRNKKASKKQRKSNRNQSTWSFAELQQILSYKAKLRGSATTKVDAHYTSQMCVRCGHTSKANRPGKGLVFSCEACGFELHADLVGARNIAMRTLLSRQDLGNTGHLSVAPDASNDEVKADVLQRYSELRWSSEASPTPCGWGN